jgi:hypothetical protein
MSQSGHSNRISSVPTTAITAAQVASKMSGVYPPRQNPTRSTTNTEQQRALPPPPPERTPSSTAATAKDINAAEGPFKGGGCDADPYGSQHSYGNEAQGG